MDISRLAQKLRESDFGPDESVIASSIMHPIEAAKRGAEWFGGQVNRAANIPDPFDNPNPTRGYTPEQQLEAGLNLAGMAQTGAFPMAPATRGGTLGSIAVSHGSPHKFEKFDFTKIGTGEGAQAYGHGLYFAESPEIAKWYQDQLGKYYDEMITPEGSMSLSEAIKKYHPQGEAASKVADMFRNKLDVNSFNKAVEDVYLPEMRSSLPESQWSNFQPQVGHMYDVSLEWPDAAREAADPMGPQHFLDWDAPFSGQPEHVKKAWSEISQEYGVPLNEGELIGNTATRAMLEPELKKRGIPGIRYLDQGSRGAGQGTSNYVVFDDEIPKIISRNGVELARLLREK